MKTLAATIFLLVSSAVGLCAEEKKPERTMKFTLQWGGYYVSRGEDGKFSLIRILDFNVDAYHAAMFTEKFEKIPTLDQVKKLSPFVGHAPIDSKALLNRVDLTYLGSEKLKEDDLDGYSYYLEAHQVDEDEVKKLMTRIIGFSGNKPMILELSLKDGELQISEPK
ncbi:hypothetical protein [Haloferula rosea]|uniref:Lipoprotein n=1 Tax=Haloferula rosea TaxID=490093 RepID=A0A934VHG4_9BACT|nr:hypothetical protein [Haloferula rosea]MBK1829036.1 hypothetical protein [Haloferula rosea]